MRHHSDRGSVATETALLAPLLIALALLMILAYRVSGTQSDVHTIAHTAARAASLERTDQQAHAAAEQATEEAVREHELRCEHRELELTTSGMQPGATVTAEVTCQAPVSDLSSLDLLPGTYTAHGQASAVVDLYRGQP